MVALPAEVAVVVGAKVLLFDVNDNVFAAVLTALRCSIPVTVETFGFLVT